MMGNEQREHINKIRKDFQANQRVKDSLNNSIKALADDLYSKDTHFIFELIQNAEDNEYEGVKPSISFLLTKKDPTNTEGSDGALIIQNNETGFNLENVDAICAVGKSTKKKAQGYIGEKGIGFKSVFRVTTTPHVFSNSYSFCLPEHDEKTGLGYIVPQWVDNIPDGIDPCQTTIILPLDKIDFGYERISGMLRDIESVTILFLSKLKKIHVESDNVNTVEIVKDGTERDFVCFSDSFDKPDDISHEKRSGIDKREVSIAFPCNGNYELVGKVFAYLPVRSDTGLPFLINADFILISSREDIHWDLPWNQWLMRCVAELFADALPKLKEQGKLTIELLEMLANRVKDISDQSEFSPIADAVRNALLEKELLPTDDGTFVSAKNAKLVSGSALRKLLGDKQRQALFPEQEAFKWLSDGITQDKTPGLSKYLKETLDVVEIEPRSFARKIESAFLVQQSDEWMVTFYQFLNGQPALWKKGSGNWHNPDGPLRNKPIIRLQDGSHVSPFKQDGFSNAYLPPQEDTVFPFVKREICKDEKALEFLRKLKFRKPDAVAEVIEHIIPKYMQVPLNISDDEHTRDMKKIIQAYSTDSQEKKKTLKDKLNRTAFIFAKNNVLQKTEYKKPDKIYFQNRELLLYFDGNKEVRFVRLEYDSSFHAMFNDIGVADKVRIICQSENYSLKNVKLNSETCPYVYRRGLKGFDPDIQIDGLEHAVMNPSVERSTFIWNEIAVKYYHCIKGKVLRCSRQDFSPNASTHEEQNITSSFGSLLMNNPWLPDQQGDFHKPSELKLDDLPEAFERDEKLASQLDMNDVVAKLAEAVGISPDILQLIKDNPEQAKKFEAEVAAQQQPPEFPSRGSSNAERRKKHTEKQINNATPKEYEPRTRNVRTSRESIDPKTFLTHTYTNQNSQMICQICEKEMPFKRHDDEYYFEEREILCRDYLPKEHEAQHLALCPLCAAKYKYFILNPKNEKEQLQLITELKQTESCSIPITLGEENTTLRFVETHLADLKAILETLDADHD